MLSDNYSVILKTPIKNQLPEVMIDVKLVAGAGYINYNHMSWINCRYTLVKNSRKIDGRFFIRKNKHMYLNHV